MSISNEAVSELISKGLPDAIVEVTGDGYKYEAKVICSCFEGLNTLKKHQLVYAAVDSAITSGDLHALTIIALTPEEAV
ncbi:MAG: BolA/IbaG family iron-sulfur metabolism protein [Cocleimonas sp.]|nr:BolA/IbaG family iron-sulfur metabolism protein [Cocleimonas sp.]